MLGTLLRLLTQRTQPFQLDVPCGKLVVSLTELAGNLLVPGVCCPEVMIEPLDLAGQVVAFGVTGIKLSLEVLDLRAELVAFGVSGIELSLEILDLRAKLVLFDASFLQSAVKLLGLDSSGLKLLLALGNDTAKLSLGRKLGLKPPDLLSERLGLAAERIALIPESLNLSGSKTAKGIPERREFSAQVLMVLPLLVQFRLEPLLLAASLLDLLQDRVVFRLKTSVFLFAARRKPPRSASGPRRVRLKTAVLFPGGQFGATCRAEGRKLADQLGSLTDVSRGLDGRTRDFRLPVKPVEEMPLCTLGPGCSGRFHDVLDQKFVAACLAQDMMTGISPADAQGCRARRASHGNAPGLRVAGVDGTSRELFGAGRCHQIRSKSAERVLAILAADVVAAVRMPDPQADEAVGANGHKVRGHLAHGSSSADTGVNIRGAEAENWITALVYGRCTRSLSGRLLDFNGQLTR